MVKTLGLGLVAALVAGTVGLVSATAETGGHFTSEVEHTTLKGNDLFPSIFQDPGIGAFIECEGSYTSTVFSATKTVTEVTLTPVYKNCEEKVREIEAKVDMNGCDYLLTIRKVEPEKKDNTALLKCPGANVAKIEVLGPFGTCEITIKAQTPGEGGVTYVTGGTGKLHDITAEVTLAGIHALYHGGMFKCGYAANPKTVANDVLGTPQATIKGFNAANEQVGITATGN